MKRILWSLLILMTLVAAGCGYNSSVSGADTGTGTGTGGTTAAVIAGLDVSVSKATLKTDGTDTVDFTVYVKDANSVAAKDTVVSVASTGGVLSVSSVKTDASGKATFTLGVGSEKTNQLVTVTLTAGSVVKTQTITISGTTLALTATKLVTTTTDASPIELTATLRDGAAQPISGATIIFNSPSGNTFTPFNGNVFTTGSTGLTDSAGLFKVRYNGATVCVDDNVTSTSSGVTSNVVKLTSDAVSLASFGFTTPDDTSDPFDISAVPIPLKVTWINADGTKASDKTLTFYTNKGYFGTIGTSMTTALTDALGVATVQFSTGETAGPVQVTVFDSTAKQTATLNLQVRATTPASIDVQVSPGVIPVSTATTSSTATIKATVRDAKNQAVAGKVVGFSIVSGPGAGEFISPVTATTNDGGIATSTITSGSMSSAQDGVKVQATVAGVAPKTTNMTISEAAASVTIGTTNNLEYSGTTGYTQKFTVLVTNSNGGAVPGAIVSLSIVPIRFYTGPGVGDGPPSPPTGVYAAEDTNRNYILDSGEDCAPQLDIISLQPTGKYWVRGSSDVVTTIFSGTHTNCVGNGRLDPGAVASIEPTVTTGADGMAVFMVNYPKSFGNWVDVEITASADVTGTNASDKISTLLYVIEDDHPHMPSPFGLDLPIPDLTAIPGDGKNLLTWSAGVGAASYNIYWSTTPGVTVDNNEGFILDIKSSPYTHSNLTNGTTYYYIVAPVTKYGYVGTPSVEDSATPVAAPVVP